MRLLLVGPYPPPHGGISVHVSELHRQLKRLRVDCRVLNIDRDAAPGDGYERVRNGLDLVRAVWRCSAKGFVIHVHINGHNRKAWLIAWACAMASVKAPARLLTLHSGMTPSYVASSHGAWRWLLRRTCLCYHRIICVSAPIREAIRSFSIPDRNLNIIPAFLPSSPSHETMPAELQEWMQSHRPLLSTTLFFRPEYGFDLLVKAMPLLSTQFPRIGCLVMGSREGLDAEQAHVEQLGVDQHFRFLGDVDHDLCLALISQSDVYVRPTLEDGDSISVREAVHLGVPVVASDVGVRPAAATLFPAGNARDMVSRIADVLSAAARTTAANPGEPSNESALFDIYGGLLDRTKLKMERP